MSRRVNSGWLYHSCRQHEQVTHHQSHTHKYTLMCILDTAGLVGQHNQESNTNDRYHPLGDNERHHADATV